MLKKINDEISFADSEFVSLDTESEILNVIFRSWDNNLIRIQFSDPIGISYTYGDIQISGVFEDTDSDQFYQNALAKFYEKASPQVPYKNFKIMDDDNYPFIQVVALDVRISADT